MKTYDPHKSKTELRQSNDRRMNMRVLIWSIGALVVLFALIYVIYAIF